MQIYRNQKTFLGEMQVVYQNQFLEESQVQLKITNRGFLYGDGFFETILYINNQIPYLEKHLKRITHALSAFDLVQPSDFNLTYLTETIHQLCHNNKLNSARVKIMIWRSEGGFYSPVKNNFDFLITSAPLLLASENKELVSVYPENINSISTTSEFKPLSAYKYVSAGLFKNKNNLNDVIILGQNDVISEALYSNLFWEKDKQLFTPSLETGCVNGVMRTVIMSEGETIKEVAYHKSELFNADAVFTSNALGIQHIIKIDGTNYTKSDFAQNLIENLISKYV